MLAEKLSPLEFTAAYKLGPSNPPVWILTCFASARQVCQISSDHALGIGKLGVKNKTPMMRILGEGKSKPE